MATVKKLMMPNGDEFRFVGKQWYGVCTTVGSSRNKTVSITGFDGSDLFTGVRVTVRFNNAQSYNGTPTLNVSGTGEKNIARRSSLNSVSEIAGQYEWNANSIITFTYSGFAWVIDDGEAATTTYYGKTKLSNTISNDQTTALTPYAVYNAGFLTLADLPIYDGTVE